MKIDNFLDDIKLTKLFKNLSNEDLIKLFDQLNYEIHDYCKEDIIFVQDDECKNLSVILEGTIEIQKIDVNGKVLSVANFTKGDTFGENLIFGDSNKFPMTVIAKQDTTILNIRKDSVIDLCQRNTSFLYEYLRLISNKAFILSSRIRDVTLKTIRQKICEFLMMQYKAQNSNVIAIKMTRKEWADKLGVQRPSLSRELIKLKDEDLIDFDKNTLTIKDIDTIKDFVQ